MKQDYLVIDIETVPHRLDEYKTLFPNSKKKGGLHAIISEVVCVGLGDENQISILDRQEFESEKGILIWLGKVLRESQNKQIVTFNGKAFDLTFLAVRAMMYDMKLALPDNRAARNVDLYSDYPMGGKWQSDISSCSLRELIWAKYHETPTTESGSHVAELYASGKLEEIADHCREDVEWTRRLYVDFAASK